MIQSRINNNTSTLLSNEREDAWKKLDIYNDSFKELKTRLYDNRDKDKITLSSTDNLLVLSSLSIILGELGWRRSNEEGNPNY
jgi:hypothetical protein